jgi:Fe2+ or Zn2+ uptake regulation protein
MVDLDDLSQQYLKLRQQRELLAEKYKEADRAIEVMMAELENQMLEELNKTNATSINTKSSTILKRVTKRYNPTNWDAVYELVHKYKAYGLLHKRVHDGNMSTFLEEHPDEYPAGLNLDSRYAVTVKRKSGE